MGDAPDSHELNLRIARLEGRIKTMKAENETGFERLSKELAQRDLALILAVAILKFAWERRGSLRPERLCLQVVTPGISPLGGGPCGRARLRIVR